MNMKKKYIIKEGAMTMPLENKGKKFINALGQTLLCREYGKALEDFATQSTMHYTECFLPVMISEFIVSKARSKMIEFNMGLNHAINKELHSHRLHRNIMRLKEIEKFMKEMVEEIEITN